jgi:hypothetical protein
MPPGCFSNVGIAWASFIVAVFTNKMVPSDFQAYVIDYLNRSVIEREKQRYAAIMIQRHWRLHKKYQRLAARGVDVPPHVKAAKYTEELTPIIRKFQSIQRKEMNKKFILNEPSITQIDVTQQRNKNEPADSGHGDRPNFPSLTAGNQTASRSINATASAADVVASAPTIQRPASSTGSPLVRTSYTSYGSTPSATRSLVPESHPMRMNLKRATSEVGRGLGIKKSEMSAEHALKALHYLNRTSPHAQSLSTLGPAPGPLNRRGSLPVSRDYIAVQNIAIQNLLAAQVNMQQHLTTLESKIDQLLARAHGESMLTAGHVFLSWSTSEDALSTPIFIWHEKDLVNKYGVLYWTREEFAIQHRLRIKHEGNSMPCHSITDVFLGQ